MRPQKILVVAEENAEARELVDMLEALNFQIAALTAVGRQAIDDAIVHEPDLAIVDLSLRGEPNAIDVARTLRDSLGIPIVLLIDVQEGPLYQQSLSLGDVAHICRPLRRADVHRAAIAALYKHSPNGGTDGDDEQSVA